jgi:hypothetical protein
MSIRADHNLYPGINPHLNSALQQPGGGWRSFHAHHLIHIADLLDATLPPGYTAKPEESIQISLLPDEFNPGPPQRSIPDILIVRTSDALWSSSGTALAEPEPPTLVLPVWERLLDDPEDSLSGLVLYKARQPVTRIELLSPANKPGGSHYGTYLQHRQETLRAGLRLVEIDYLHERSPIKRDIPSYRDREPNAFPYHILINDPRPAIDQGQTRIFSRGVLDLLPVIRIPLGDDDGVQFNTGEAYNFTLSRRTYTEDIDYAQEPVNMSAYTEADQSAIRARMAQIAQETHS